VRHTIAVGQSFPPISSRNIHGVTVNIPDEQGRTTHLQFRRFGGCPICNLHLQSFAARYREIEKAGIKEVVVFHSSDKELLPYQGRFPFDVIGDQDKVLYRKYGVKSSVWAILNPLAWSASIRGNLREDKPTLKGLPHGGILGLPADILVSPDGTVKAVHYGKHAADQWEVDEVVTRATAR
jgi:peroxiredoxin